MRFFGRAAVACYDPDTPAVGLEMAPMQHILQPLALVGRLGMQASAAPSQTAEEAAVKAAVQSFVDAWNRHDMEAFAAVFTEDADFVNVRGTRWIGRSAIREGHAAAHATIFKNSQLRILELSVRFLKPDVAVARWACELTGQTTPAGESVPARKAIPTFVMTKTQDRWLIVVAQNTDIVPAARPPQ
jgi:uncharacterized protein (TIGR02246 family)